MSLTYNTSYDPAISAENHDGKAVSLPINDNLAVNESTSSVSSDQVDSEVVPPVIASTTVTPSSQSDHPDSD